MGHNIILTDNALVNSSDESTGTVARNTCYMKTKLLYAGSFKIKYGRILSNFIIIEKQNLNRHIK